MLVFTSCTNNYIPKARVLAHSLKAVHSDWEFCLLLGEEPPAGFDLSGEPFDRMLTFDCLPIADYEAWRFRHSVVEICTAAKGPALDYFINVEGQEKVIYLDPDIMVLSSLAPLADALDEYDILLTPHQLAPQTAVQAVVDNEICSLKHGVYNLGFVAVAGHGQGSDFCRWWKDRLYSFCYDDIANGLFTDQRWCDLAPAFFSRLHIVRDPGCNAASWNLTDRHISQNPDGSFTANKQPLRFYHFTGYDSGAGKTMSAIYGADMPAVAELWRIYGERLQACGHEQLKDCAWQGMFFSDGTPVTDAMRRLYREEAEMQTRFPDPYTVTGSQECYRDFYIRYHDSGLWAKLRRKLRFCALLPGLMRQYWGRHGRKTLPRLVKTLWLTVRANGLQGVMGKVRSFRQSVAVAAADLPELSGMQQGRDRRHLACRARLAAAFRHRGAVCIIDHMYGGGANSYREKLLEELRTQDCNVLVLTWDFFSQHLLGTAYLCHEGGADVVRFRAADLEEMLVQDFMRFDRVILNELVLWSSVRQGRQLNPYDAVPNILHTVCQLASRHGALLEAPVHDYFAVCPSYCLVNAENRYCGIPESSEVCGACLQKSSLDVPQGFDIAHWRAAWQRFFEAADRVRVFSCSSAQLLGRVFRIPSHKLELAPHAPLVHWSVPYRLPQTGSMRIAVIGDISIHKGAGIVGELAGLLEADEDLVVIGRLDSSVARGRKVTVHGPYQRAQLPALLAEYGITIGLIPSVCPETFCYVVQECMLLGLPLVCFDLGAQAERIGAWEKGLVADEISAGAACAALRTLDARRLARGRAMEP